MFKLIRIINDRGRIYVHYETKWADGTPSFRIQRLVDVGITEESVLNGTH